jgi:hypothetical protein
MTFPRIAGGALVVFGVLFLAHIFAWSTLLAPRFTGLAWWAAVFRAMFSSGAIAGTLLVKAIVAGGVLLLALPRGRYLNGIAVAIVAIAALWIAIAVILG